MILKMILKMIPKTFFQHFPSWRRVCIVPIIYVYLCIVPTYLTFVVITTYTKLCVFQNVTAGSVNPAAIYVVSTIYNPTNNVVPIKYRTKIPNHIYNPPINVCSPERNGASHCAAHFCVYKICINTNNVVTIKYRNQNLKPYLQHTHQCVSSKFILPILPLGGDTPFYLISQRNRRFLFDG